MASASFRMNVKIYADKAQNTQFDLQDSKYHFWPHPITVNFSFKYFFVADWPKSKRYFFITSLL